MCRSKRRRRLHAHLAQHGAVELRSLSNLRKTLIKVGAQNVDACHLWFQIAAVAIPRELLADILRRIDRLDRHRPQHDG